MVLVDRDYYLHLDEETSSQRSFNIKSKLKRYVIFDRAKSLLEASCIWKRSTVMVKICLFPKFLIGKKKKPCIKRAGKK